jgi:hypothetical protein
MVSGLRGVVRRGTVDVASRLDKSAEAGHRSSVSASRAVLADLFSGRVDRVPNRSGRYLWARFDCDIVNQFDIGPGTEFEDFA